MIKAVGCIRANAYHPEMPVETGISRRNRHHHTKFKSASVLQVYNESGVRIVYFITSCPIKVDLPYFPALWINV